MRWVLFAVAFVVTLVLILRRRREAEGSTPALRLAGGPPDEAEDAAAGRPLFDAIAAALRANGGDVAAIEADDWGYVAEATVAGQTLKLRLGAHGSNGVGRVWLLELEGANPEVARAVEQALAVIDGLRVLGWDD
jgi:hypothetical protein